MEPRFLVTGASGFVGSALVQRLRESGNSWIGIGRRKLDGPNYISHDLGHAFPQDRIEGQAFDAVIHAAARASPWGPDRQFEHDNVVATKNVVDYCERCDNPPKLIFISSSSVYYRPTHQFNLTESSPLAEHPINAYAATKMRAERIVETYSGDWCILRPRAVFGPGDTVLLPRIISAAKQGKLPRLVTGGEPVVGDLIYIDNLVDYIMLSATSTDVQGVYNLTNNEPVPIWDFLSSVLQQMGIAPPSRRVSIRSAMLAATCLEIFYRYCMPAREPAITRFGVHVFAYSKTFDVRKCLNAMGNVRVPLEQGVHRTVSSLRSGAVERVASSFDGKVKQA
ncbi:MAG: NAD(P)-dependent oxidoreductase [Planctomycetales bacterium]|nr:NAD(P)-dependent oxidoreductase [Planctomycetales bacterium]